MYGPHFEMDAPVLTHKGLLASCHVCAAVVLQINGDSQQHKRAAIHISRVKLCNLGGVGGE